MGLFTDSTVGMLVTKVIQSTPSSLIIEAEDVVKGESYCVVPYSLSSIGILPFIYDCIKVGEFISVFGQPSKRANKFRYNSDKKVLRITKLRLQNRRLP